VKEGREVKVGSQAVKQHVKIEATSEWGERSVGLFRRDMPTFSRGWVQ